MNIMTKQGSLDNQVTYEHFCDAKEDLNNIPKNQVTLGSSAVVLKDTDGSMGVYLADSNKNWISFATGSGSSGGNSNNGGIFPYTIFWTAGDDTMETNHTYAEFKEAYDEGLTFVCSNNLCATSIKHDEVENLDMITFMVFGFTLTTLSVGFFILKPDESMEKQFEAVFNIDEMKTNEQGG